MPTTFGQQFGFVIGIILALIAIFLGVMYGVTGKIPFYSEPRRKTFRRKSYRRENMGYGDIIAGDTVPYNQVRTEGYGDIIAGGTVPYNQVRTEGYGDIIAGGTVPYNQVRTEGTFVASDDEIERIRDQVRTQILDPRGPGRMAAQQLKSGCSECYRTIRQFAQGVGEEMDPSDFVSMPVSYTDMYN